jgi:neopullulanase
MWSSRTQVYAAEQPIGGRQTPYSTTAPLYKAIAEMARIRAADAALRRGRQIVRAAGDAPGLFALSRLDQSGGETLALFNSSTAAVTAQVEVEPGSLRWQAVRGDCESQASAPASYAVRIPPLDYLICKSTPQ